MSDYKKYYLAMANDDIRGFYTQEDLDILAEQGDNRSPFEIFSGGIPEEQITDIFVCELTNEGLIKRMKLDENLEEIAL